jgi:hypothetical protein
MSRSHFTSNHSPENDDAEDVTESSEAATDQIEDRVARLDATIMRSMTERREASIEAGRAFNELKKLLGHGKWKRHFDEMFASQITLRTAERWMKRAAKANIASRSDSVSNFKSASDQDAQNIREATEQAQAEVDAQSAQRKVKKEGRLYMLPLHMTDDEKNAMDALRKSPHWPLGEEKILSRLRRLWIKFGIVEEVGGDHS